MVAKVQGGIADLAEARRTVVSIDDASFVVRFVGYRTLGNICGVYVETEADPRFGFLQQACYDRDAVWRAQRPVNSPLGELSP